MRKSRSSFHHSLRLAAVLVGCAAFSLFAADRCIQPGEHIPDFSLPAVRGDSFHLHAPDVQPALLAFLQSVPDTADTPSRSQVAQLQSMDHQYRARGLRVVIIDATALATGSKPDHNSLINASYDWNLQIPLLEDENGSVARMIGVTHLPTTILVAADGRAAQVWERPVPPGVMAVAIETAFGSGPLVPRSTPQDRTKPPVR
jgi:peroxiredoxin